MIELLTSESFAAYGVVLANDKDVERDKCFENPVRERILVEKRSTKFICSENTPVYLESDGDFVLLFVSPDKDFKQRDIFLLDKPIMINPGVLYCLNAMDEDCKVKCVTPACAIFREITAPDGDIGVLTPKVNINKIYTLFYQEKEKGFLFKGESHDFWELTYVDKGYLRTSVDGEEWVLNQGEAMFYDRGQHHTQYADKDVAVCYITITFDMELDEHEALLGCKFTIDNTLAQLLDKILYEKERSIFYSEDLIACYLKEFIINLYRLQMLQGSSPATAYQINVERGLVESAAALINEKITQRFTVGEIAACVNVSQSYLSVLFKRHKKLTLIEYINSIRLDRCKDLIREGQYSITKISEMMGYSSVHYMSRQFKNNFGVSPSEYAKML